MLSILLALILWFNISGTQSAEVQKSFPVKLQTSMTAAGMLVLGQGQQTVEVNIKGPKREVATVRVENIQAKLNLLGFTDSGQYLVPVSVEGLPQTVSVGVEPQQVFVTLEKQVKKGLVPVLVNGERVQDNLKFQAALKDQSPVEVSGLQREVARVARIEARPDMSGITEALETQRPANLIAVDASGMEVPNINLTPQTLPTVIRVFRLPPFKEVPVQPKFSGRVPDGYTFSVSIDPDTIRVRGPQEQHQSWEEVITAPIDLSGQIEPFTVQAQLVKPPGAESLDRDYITVTVNVTELWTERMFSKVKLDHWHLAANLEALPAVQEVTFRLSGPKLILDKFNPDNLVAHLELENLGPGTHALPVRFTKPRGLEVVSVEPDRLEISISEKKP